MFTDILMNTYTRTRKLQTHVHANTQMNHVFNDCIYYLKLLRTVLGCDRNRSIFTKQANILESSETNVPKFGI